MNPDPINVNIQLDEKSLAAEIDQAMAGFAERLETVIKEVVRETIREIIDARRKRKPPEGEADPK